MRTKHNTAALGIFDRHQDSKLTRLNITVDWENRAATEFCLPQYWISASISSRPIVSRTCDETEQPKQ